MRLESCFNCYFREYVWSEVVRSMGVSGLVEGEAGVLAVEKVVL